MYRRRVAREQAPLLPSWQPRCCTQRPTSSPAPHPAGGRERAERSGPAEGLAGGVRAPAGDTGRLPVAGSGRGAAGDHSRLHRQHRRRHRPACRLGRHDAGRARLTSVDRSARWRAAEPARWLRRLSDAGLDAHGCRAAAAVLRRRRPDSVSLRIIGRRLDMRVKQARRSTGSSSSSSCCFSRCSSGRISARRQDTQSASSNSLLIDAYSEPSSGSTRRSSSERCAELSGTAAGGAAGSPCTRPRFRPSRLAPALQ